MKCGQVERKGWEGKGEPPLKAGALEAGKAVWRRVMPIDHAGYSVRAGREGQVEAEGPLGRLGRTQDGARVRLSRGEE